MHTPRATNHHPSTVPAPSAIRDVYVLARRRDDVLLLLRSGTGYRDGEWGPPAGKVEPGETYAEAAARELAEETGIRVGPLDLRFLHVVRHVIEATRRGEGHSTWRHLEVED